MMVTGDELTIRLVCRDLPGIRFAESGESTQVRQPVYLGIQKGKEVVEAVPGDRHQVTYDATLRVAKVKNGQPNFLGAYAHGTPDDRFVCLCWGQMSRGGHFEMFR